MGWVSGVEAGEAYQFVSTLNFPAIKFLREPCSVLSWTPVGSAASYPVHLFLSRAKSISGGAWYDGSNESRGIGQC